MTTVLILNIIFSATVVAGIVGLLGWSIAAERHGLTRVKVPGRGRRQDHPRALVVQPTRAEG